MSTASFAAVAVSIYAAHQVGDFWVQTSRQAAVKGEPGWAGRRACALHVLTYTVTLIIFVDIMAWWCSVWPDPGWFYGGLALSAVTHYWSDRRTPLRRLADLLGKGGFYRAGEGLASGAFVLDQAWHWFWLFGSALLISGPPR